MEGRINQRSPQKLYNVAKVTEPGTHERKGSISEFISIISTGFASLIWTLTC